MIINIALVVLLIIVVYNVVILSIQKGKKPAGERLERIKENENYINNLFQNEEDTEMDSPPMEGIKEMMKSNPNHKPVDPIKNLAIDLSKFNQNKKNETLVCWLGHSTFLVQMNGTTMLVDPVFSKRASMFQLIGPKKFNYYVDYKISDLPPIDFVLISHDHYDHLDYRVIKQLKNKVKHFYMPLGVGAHFEHWGINLDQITELAWWQSTTLNDITLTATPGRHFTGRFTSDRFKTLWCGWSLKSNSSSLYYSGDSGYFNGFKEIGEKLGPFDFALMECGQYSKYWPFIHMFPEQAVQAANDVKAKIAMPIHWGKFKLSIHAWTESPERFLEEAQKQELLVSTPEIGEVFNIEDLRDKRWWRN